MRLIDGDEAIEKVQDIEPIFIFKVTEVIATQRTSDVIAMLENAPTIEAEPVKHGRWIVVSDGYGNGDATAHICECSECKDTIWVYNKATRRWNYCPNCGAVMEER